MTLRAKLRLEQTRKVKDSLASRSFLTAPLRGG